MKNPMVEKISALISRLETVRVNIYPADWDADPLYDVIKELRRILAAEKEEQFGKPALRKVGMTGQ